MSGVRGKSGTSRWCRSSVNVDLNVNIKLGETAANAGNRCPWLRGTTVSVYVKCTASWIEVFATMLRMSMVVVVVVVVVTVRSYSWYLRCVSSDVLDRTYKNSQWWKYDLAMAKPAC